MVMRMLPHLVAGAAAALVLVSVGPAHALFHEEAGALDWHTKLVGTPISVVVEPPSLLGQQLFVATNKNVLASIDSSSGELAWRQLQSKLETHHGAFLSSQDTLVTISSSDVVHVRAWNPQTGRLLWDNQVEPSVNPSENSCTNAALVQSESAIATVLPSCDVVLMSLKGRQYWKVAHKKGESFTRATITDTSVHTVSWSAIEHVLSNRIYNIKNGTMSAETHVKHVVLSSPNDVFFVGQGGNIPSIVWNDSAKNRSFVIRSGETLAHEIVLPGYRAINSVEAVSTGRDLAIMVAKTLAEPVAISIDAHGQAKVVHSFGKGSEQHESIYASEIASSGSYAVARLALRSSTPGGYSLETWHSMAGFQRTPIPINEKTYGRVKKIHLAGLAPNSEKPQHKVMITTQDGSIHFFTGANLGWVRDEAHSQVAAAAFLDLPLNMAFSDVLDELNEEPKVTAALSVFGRYLRRWEVQMAKLKSGINRVMRLEGLNQTASKGAYDTNNYILSDPHGFQKILLLATTTGRVSGIDTITGEIKWSRFFDGVLIKNMHVIRKARVKFPPVIAITGVTSVGTSVWRIHGLSGADYTSKERPDIPIRTDFNKRLGEFFLLDLEENDDHTQLMLFFDQEGNVETYPRTDSARAVFERVRERWHFYRIKDETGIHGFDIKKAQTSGVYPTEKTWCLDFAEGERLVSVASQQRGSHSVASIGRVLGDRKVLYKYLNPNLLGLVTVRKDDRGHVTTFFYIVDAVSGSIHLRNAHHGAGQSSDRATAIFALQCENWFVYTVWNHGQQAIDDKVMKSLEDAPQPTRAPIYPSTNTDKDESKENQATVAKPYKKASVRAPVPNAKQLEVVVLEAYEDATPDRRIESSTMSSFGSTRPAFQGQAYVLPVPITAMGVTQTEAGITTREILFGVEGGLLYALNKRVLDPRRPFGKPSVEEREAGIAQYSPNIGFNTLSVPSYDLEVLGIEHVLSGATNLESTSIVAAYGIDIFCTRRTPSQAFDVISSDFNYVALVATIVALMIGIAVAKTFADRKKLNDLWKH